VLSYLGVFAVVFGVNLLPVLGPPTWSILVLYRLHSGLNAVALVGVGALAAALGRFVLGHVARTFRPLLSTERRSNLDAVATAVRGHRRSSVIGLALFALSPVPSAQLFEAAGIAGAPLAPLTLAFFAGRVVSYGIYVAGASALKNSSVGDAFRDSLTSPSGIALQILMIFALVLLARVDWRRHLHRPGS
jgi:membrane protein YqaA with SNARE-associated domain